MPPLKEIKKTYYVRNFHLHREIVAPNGRKTRQTYLPGEPVDLTIAEAKRYRRLIETEEQVNSRKGGKK